MTEFDSSAAGRALAPVPAGEPGAAEPRPAPRGASRELMIVVELPDAKFAGSPQGAPGRRFFPSRFHLAAAAALAIVAGVAGALLVENREQARALAERASETQSLAHAVKSLKVRLDAIDTAVTNSDADLRQSVGEIKSNAASARQISGALAQLSQRVDRLDHDSSAKGDRLTERVDRQASAATAGLSTRIDRPEQKVATPPAPPAPAQGAPPKPPVRPRFGAVALDQTGSIGRPRPILRSYVVLGARDDVALIGGRYGEREVREGDFLPGAGRVERIEARGDQWVVMTSEGLIAEADSPPY